MTINKPLWERTLIFLSAIPIAIAVNVLRITSTGIAYSIAGEVSDWVHYVFHDNAGLLMMPLAAEVWLEQSLMQALVNLLNDPLGFSVVFLLFSMPPIASISFKISFVNPTCPRS